MRIHIILLWALMPLVTALCGCSLFSNQSDETNEEFVRLPDRFSDTEANADDNVRQVAFESEPIEDPQQTNDAPKSSPWQSFSVDNITTAVKNAAGYGTDEAEARRLYDQAIANYKSLEVRRQRNEDSEALRAEFSDVGDTFMKAAANWPDSALQQDSFYFAGESYFFADAYVQSNKAFEKLIEAFPGTRFLDKAEARRFVIAQYWSKLNDLNPDYFWEINFTDAERPMRNTGGLASRILDKIRLDDPTGKFADDSTLELANNYYKDGKFLDAADTYADLRKSFPGSAHQYHAHLFELKARLNAYQGPNYDGDGLEKAEKLLKTLLKQFPKQSNDDREYLTGVAGEIRHGLAERVIKMARYYDRRQEYRAARFYYAQVIDNYSDSTLIDEARTRFAEIKDNPSVPPQRLKWMVELFPIPVASKPLINNAN